MSDMEKFDAKGAGAGIDMLEELSRVNNELADMHRELGRLNVELRKLNEEKNQFVGMAAHDIRKPLAVISSFSDILIEDLTATLDPEHVQFLTIIDATARAALDVVNSFLDITKIEAGTFELNPEPCDLMDCIRQAVRFNMPQAQKKNIALHVHHEQTVIPCTCDSQKIGQVLDNLISNAVKFSPHGATVDIAVASDRGGRTVSVRDHGQGIAPDELDRLFKPFGRASSKATGGESSTGLGLAISRKIVEAHGGEIRVESAPGQGAVFIFFLPAGQGPGAGAQGSGT